MTSFADKAIFSGADNHPPMLEKDMYDSWKSRMELYMLNRQHGRMILESVEHGPLLWPTVEEDRVTRLKKYFSKGDDPIDAINHMMSFLTAVVTSRVTNQLIQGRQNSMSAGLLRPFASGSGGASGRQRVIVCYNCKGKGHILSSVPNPRGSEMQNGSRTKYF
nr:hypothetical protein [Tanacetum cinerariifolium]